MKDLFVNPRRFVFSVLGYLPMLKRNSFIERHPDVVDKE